MTGRRGTRATAMCAAVACAGVLAAGCSSSGGSSGLDGKDPATVLAGAGQSISSAKSVAISEDVNDAGDTGKLTGAVDFATKVQAHLTMKYDKPSAGMPDTVEVYVSDGTMYLNADAMLSGGGADDTMTKMLGGKHWVKIAPDTATDSGSAPVNTPGSLIGAVGLGSDRDLVKALTTLLGSGLLKPDGTAHGDFHYSGTLDANSLASAKFDDAHRTSIGTAFKDQDVASEKIEVWIDGSGLPTEIKFADTANSGPGSSGDVKFSGWGKPVTVAVPADSDAVDFSQMLSGSGQS